MIKIAQPIIISVKLKNFFSSALFISENPSPAKSFAAGLLFILLTPIVLWLDSDYFFTNYFNGRWLANGMAILYFLWLFSICGSHLRKLVFTMVFVSYIGELIFSSLLGMYGYRTEFIPLYVPLGHSIVYASGYIYANSSFALKNEQRLKKIFPVLFIVIFLIPGIWLYDIFTLFFGIFFFAILKRKRWQNLYYFVALCVIYIELLGTGFGCWKWVPETFGFIPAANPPMGAVFFYAGGDVLIAKIVKIWESKMNSKLNIEDLKLQ